jgi:hypothetical protein
MVTERPNWISEWVAHDGIFRELAGGYGRLVIGHDEEVRTHLEIVRLPEANHNHKVAAQQFFRDLLPLYHCL